MDKDDRVVKVKVEKSGTPASCYLLLAGLLLVGGVYAYYYKARLTAEPPKEQVSGVKTKIIENNEAKKYMIPTETINITGDVTGGSVVTAYGIYNVSTGTINITGNLTGGAARKMLKSEGSFPLGKDK